MRRTFVLFALSFLVVLPTVAQNTDIEALAGLQFNFGNPGARSLGMGGAFLGLADDASAVEANPAGLTILRKPEVSLEARNYQEQQIFTTSGTFPKINRTAFSHYSQAAEITFLSFVYPGPLKLKNLTVGVYYHEPLRNVGAGRDVDIQSNPLTGRVSATTPNFFLATKNPTGPLSESECIALRKQLNDFFACAEYNLFPFISAVDVQERTYGIAGAYNFGKVSVGASVRYQRFSESAVTFRYDSETFQPIATVAQSTGDLSAGEEAKQIHSVTYGLGVKYTLNDRFSAGAVYKKGAKFLSPTFIANDQTNGEFVRVAETTFHIPDVYGAGVSVHVTPDIILNADAVHVTYSHLADKFFSINQAIRDLGAPFEANNVTEIHIGGEYAFTGFKLTTPFIRAGLWRDPAHSVEFRGPVNSIETIADAILYPKGEKQTHYSIGGGLAWKNFQLDGAYDRSPHYRVGSLSFVARF